MSEKFAIHVRTATGLEKLLAKELKALGATEIVPRSKLVTCVGNKALVYRINFHCRTAIRVLLPLIDYPAQNEKAFYEGVQRLDWSQFMKATGTLAVDAHVHSSFTTHSLFLSQFTKDAIVDQFRNKTGKRPSVDLENPDLRVVVSLYRNKAQIYLDSSGESLHRRGYRKKTGEAPLNEALAAGMIQLAEWDQKTPFVDPMCGSGTLCIEAGMLAKNIAPGLIRKHFGFQRWPDYDKSLYLEIVEAAKKAITTTSVSILGLDNDHGMVTIARENVARAGLGATVHIERADFFTAAPKGLGTLVTNPPYDERLKVENVAALWQRIGRRLGEAYGGWNVALLCGVPEVARYMEIEQEPPIPLFNGGLECILIRSKVATAKAGATRDFTLEETTFGNRLRKNVKHYAKWAKRENVSAWRVYDRDIPELPFIVDHYGDRLQFVEVKRNHTHGPLEHEKFLERMRLTAAEALGVPYKKEAFEVSEGGHRFVVNLEENLGLYLDHRPTREMIEKEAEGKDVLNLFGHTGGASVYAAAGKAKSTTTVDSSRTALDWAKRNMELNGFTGPEHRFEKMDVWEFLKTTSQQFDLAIVDPPSLSTNRATGETFRVQNDHPTLLKLVFARMRPGGRVYFSTSFPELSIQLPGKEITSKTTSVDFERRPAHRTWLFQI